MEIEKAKRYALFLLGRKSRLSHELRRKLIDKGYSKEHVEHVIVYCTEKGYLDDAAYAARFAAQEKKKGTSRRALVQKYRSKGGHVEDLPSDDTFDQEALKTHLRKWHKEEKQKVIRRLLQRGFSWDQILDCTENLKDNV
ncbi:MAG: hypothetical protein RLZZ453_709 [Chlamydiota bacterium]|jgi:regulatory protein